MAKRQCEHCRNVHDEGKIPTGCGKLERRKRDQVDLQAQAPRRYPGASVKKKKQQKK